MFIFLHMAESRCLQLDVSPAGGATGDAWPWMAVLYCRIICLIQIRGHAMYLLKAKETEVIH